MSSPYRSRLLIAMALGAATLPPLLSAAQVPPESQATLLLRILAFDRKLPAGAQGGVKIAVLFKQGDSASEAAMNGLAAALEAAAAKTTVSGLPVRVARVGFSDGPRLDADLQRERASAAYLCPGLDESLGVIGGVTRARAVLSFTGTEAYVRGGSSVGLMRRGTRAAVLVHLDNARAEGSDLDSGLLRIAEVIR
ncbi:MAG: YfiR/HmsC family protein [Myxococcaceae bacterium]